MDLYIRGKIDGNMKFYVNGQIDGAFDEPNSNINFQKLGRRDGTWNGSLDDF